MATIQNAHGDQNDLIDWLSEIKKQPEKVFIIHGEAAHAEALSKALEDNKGWQTHIPQLNQTVEL
jgi:metallo-beta-lactamase family protein